MSVCLCCEDASLLEGDWEICALCGWQDDPRAYEDAEMDGGANEMSLVEAKRYWRTTGRRLPANNSVSMDQARALVRVLGE